MEHTNFYKSLFLIHRLTRVRKQPEGVITVLCIGSPET
jgi:hypothetical protein